MAVVPHRPRVGRISWLGYRGVRHGLFSGHFGFFLSGCFLSGGLGGAAASAGLKRPVSVGASVRPCLLRP